MYTEYLAVHHASQAQVVKHLTAISPHTRAPKLAQALVVEAIHLRDLPRFVVAANEGDAIRVADFEGEEEKERLDGVEPAVDIVACIAEVESAGRWGARCEQHAPRKR